VSLIGKLHSGFVYDRRIHVLAEKLSQQLPANASVLDVGCRDGLIDKLILEKRPDVSIYGVDVLIRPETHIRVDKFDGASIPFDNGSFDAALFVDVLHHTEDPPVLLGEAARVARQAVVIKDHFEEGWVDRQTLRFMDWVGNAHHGVVLPYNYWPESRWREAFAKLGLRMASVTTNIGLYPSPFNLIFDRRLHFIARLDVGNSGVRGGQ